MGRIVNYKMLAMKLLSLHIDKYKNLTGDYDFTTQDGYIALIGENGSGKSNLLEAISLIFGKLYKISDIEDVGKFRIRYEIDGTEKTVTGYKVTDISSALYTEKDFTFSGKAEVKGTVAGTYPMEVKAEDFDAKMEMAWTNSLMDETTNVFAIKAFDNSLITEKSEETLIVRDGVIQPDLKKDVVKILKMKEETQQRGAEGGPYRIQSRVRGVSYDKYTRRFLANQIASVSISGDGDTDLDLYIYDMEGNLVTKDDSYSPHCYCSWIPSLTNSYIIKIVNRGRMFNDALVVTN